MNQLFYGDNLQVLRESIKDESVDLIYLDPPFNSKRDYNLLFKSPKGQRSEAQITAFEDSWHWAEQAEAEFHEILRQSNTDVAEMMKALRSFLGENDMMAYLTMMANRLLELHRVLKRTGSLYLHCDPTASHYLKIVLDSVFGKEHFINEIVWKRTSTHSTAKGCGPVHDVIFFYSNSNQYLWNAQYDLHRTDERLRHDLSLDAKGRKFRLSDMTGAGTRNGSSGQPWRGFHPTTIGRHWITTIEKLDILASQGKVRFSNDGKWPRLIKYQDESLGRAIGDVWDTIPPINSSAQERLGYPTQKPLALLERIIAASSNPGDVVLDPFCGCGTAVHAAQKLKRKWIGIDITCLAIGLIEKRLKDAFKDKCKFEVHGTPKDLESARDLAERDKYQFQWWAVTLIDAQPYQGKKKGADGGIDGLKFFYDVADTVARKIVVSVKGGDLKADDVRALNHVRDREKADIAILVSLREPTAGMKKDAASAGFFEWQAGGKKSPRVQLLTIEGLLSGVQRAEHPDYEPNVNFKKARREKGNAPAADLFEGN